MRHNLYIVTLLMFFPIRLLAVPALPTSVIVTQKDLTRLEVFLRGDEHSHCYFTSDNTPVALGEDGSYYYMFIEDDVLKLSSLMAHEKNERKQEELDFIKEHAVNTIDYLSRTWAVKAEKANSRRQKRSARLNRNSLGEPKAYTGRKKGLVILVNFANKEMALLDANGYFNKMFNELGFNENGAIGSVHDYFYDQSYGKFDLVFDVVGPVTVSHNFGYYGSNGTSLNGGDLRAGGMIVEACQLADNEVEYSDYDWDGDGEVDQVFVIYAGYGEASGGSKNTIWPHESHLEYQECGVLNLDGVTINTYACSCELSGGSGTTLNGIGTACHEFSHCLGLPDFYDTGYNGGYGMDYWDLMDSGAYSGPKGIGEVPTGYSAYERWFVGWLNIKELKEPCVINNMPCIGGDGVAYAIYNDNHRDEYFLLENRQNTKWFSYVGKYEDCHGLLVTHIDYSETAWRNNKVNSLSKHQRMSIIPADMNLRRTNKAELQGDLFPGLSNKTELTNTSHDAVGGRLYNLNSDGSFYMNKPLTNISESDGFISFDFMGGINVPTPEVRETKVTNDSTFIAFWKMVDGAENYTLELSGARSQGAPKDNKLLSEDLGYFKTKSNSEDGHTDLSDELDHYMGNPGWNGQKVFTSQYGVKIGTTSTMGYLMTPLLDVKNNNLTINFNAKAVTSAGADIQFVLMDSSEKSLDMQECKLHYALQSFVVNFEDVIEKKMKIKITSNERIYLSDIVIYNGLYSESELNESTQSERFVYYYINDFVSDVNYKTVSGLTENFYRYRVRANKGGAKSGWSPYQEVNLQEGSGIQGVVHDGDMAGYDLYNLNGEKLQASPPKGIYIKRNKKRTSKIIIK